MFFSIDSDIDSSLILTLKMIEFKSNAIFVLALGKFQITSKDGL
jgi:hypothetical protein